MKNAIHFFILALTMCVVLTSCKKDKEDEPTTPSTTTSIKGNVAAPSWAVSEDYDMSSSMTVTTQVDLSLTYPDQVKSTKWTVSSDDLLAAFDGENCIGLAKPTDGMFYLYVTAPKSGSAVTLKYYSASLKNLFKADETLVYSNDAIIGSVAEPYAPNWKVGK